MNEENIFTEEMTSKPVLSDIKINELELVIIGGSPCFRYMDKNGEQYFTRDMKEFFDESSMLIKSGADGDVLSLQQMLENISETVNSAASDNLIGEIANIVKPYLYLSDEREYTLLAIYIILTYCYNLYSRIPYLTLKGTKGSGKTTVLELMNLLASRPRFYTGITPAALFRTIEENRPTLLIDEVESLSKKTSSNSPIIQILNSGYQKDGKVPRVIKNQTFEFKTFGPKIIAGINELPPATMDRCLKITMHKSSVSLKRITYSPEELKAMQEIKSKMLVQISRHAGTMLEYENGRIGMTIDPRIQNRDLDLWRPVLILANVFGNGRSEYFEQMTKLALKEVEQKKEDEDMLPENIAKTIINDNLKINKIEVVMKDKTGQYVVAKSIFELIDKEDEVNYYRSQAELTNVLKKIGIEALRRRIKSKLTTLYRIPNEIY